MKIISGGPIVGKTLIMQNNRTGQYLILFSKLQIIVYILPVMTFFIALIGPKVTRFLLNAASPLR